MRVEITQGPAGLVNFVYEVYEKQTEMKVFLSESFGCV